jgi:hypothetical protein
MFKEARTLWIERPSVIREGFLAVGCKRASSIIFLNVDTVWQKVSRRSSISKLVAKLVLVLIGATIVCQSTSVFGESQAAH